MAFYLGALAVLALTLGWGCAGFFAYDLPARIMTWTGSYSWGQSSIWNRLVLLGLAPLLLLCAFCVIWLTLLLCFGRPAAVLSRHGLDGNDKVWQRVYRRLTWAYAGRTPTVYYYVQSLAWLGWMLSAASFAVTLLPVTVGWCTHVLPWTRSPAVCLSMLLVCVGMQLCAGQCRRIYVQLYGQQEGSETGSEPPSGLSLRPAMRQGAAAAQKDFMKMTEEGLVDRQHATKP